ncbi:MAG: transketolase [Synergistaceae bacterium]|jgi:transketolase|nr:transketolase [Synergistaceae bacterium]
MDAARRGELEKIALEVRKDVVRMLGVAGARGLSSALGAVEILVYLYWEQMKVYPGDRGRPDRDRFVPGKGALAPALYACLARKGFFDREELWSYSRLGAMLQGHPDIRTPGIDAPGGGLGGGIGIASGMCEFLALEGIGARVFCVVDDGEIACGSAWESIAGAARDSLGNLVLVVDSSLAGDMAAGRLEAFGWAVSRASGNDFLSLERAFREMDRSNRAPKALIARTASDGFPFSEADRGELGSPMSRDYIDNVLSTLEQGALDAEPNR